MPSEQSQLAFGLRRRRPRRGARGWPALPGRMAAPRGRPSAALSPAPSPRTTRTSTPARRTATCP
eukprot:5311208-Pyramimonas_sp.AAC.1